MDVDMPKDTSHEVVNLNSTKDRSVQLIKNELVTCLEGAMENLQKIWNEIGITEDQKEQRTKVVLHHLQTLLQDMVEEEQEMKKTMLANVKNCTEELEKLCEELGLTSPQMDPTYTILRLENELRTKVDELTMEKHERLKALKLLRDKEKSLCERLCLPSHILGQVTVPNKDQLNELDANIAYLQKELVKRQEKFNKLKADIHLLWETLEYQPQTALEKKMAESTSQDTFELSKVNLEALEVIHLELGHQHEANISLASRLMEECKSLWQKLEISDSERQSFLARWKGSKPTVIAAWKDEKQRLQALKLQHMQKFIEGLRKELCALWDKCYYGPAQRNMFLPALDTNFTEELLATHEHQVAVMKGFYEENKNMFKMVEKRETMFKKMEELELKQNDVNRFSNRGGALLKECRSRKVLEKELPKLEKELRSEIEKWEAENEQQFLVNGSRYSELMEEQWENLKTQKQQIKLERHKRNNDIMQEEIVYGSKPVTPVKRRFIGTPSKTPTKMRKFDTTASTPGRLISMCHSPKVGKGGRPPIGSSTKKKDAAKVVSKRTPRRISARLKAKRQVLGVSSMLNISKTKKNTPRKAGINTSVNLVVGSETTSNKDLSLLSCANYDDFADGLHDLENQKSNYQSNSALGGGLNSTHTKFTSV